MNTLLEGCWGWNWKQEVKDESHGWKVKEDLKSVGFERRGCRGLEGEMEADDWLSRPPDGMPGRRGGRRCIRNFKRIDESVMHRVWLR